MEVGPSYNLAIFQRGIYPPVNGYSLRASRWVLALLNRKESLGIPFLVIVSSERKSKSDEVLRERQWVEQLGGEYLHLERSSIISILGGLRAILLGQPWQVGFCSPSIHISRVKEIIRRLQVEVLISSCARIAPLWLDSNCKIILLDLVDDVPGMYQDALPNVSGILKYFYLFEAPRLFKWDAKLREMATRTFYVCPTSYSNSEWLPNGPGLILNSISETEIIRAFSRWYFIGPSTYSPNRLAVDRWLNKIWKGYSVPSGVVVGFSNRNFSNIEGVNFFPFLEDPNEVLAEAGVCIAPMISGGGQINKVTEAFLSGRLVLASNHAMRTLIGFEKNITHLECTSDEDFRRAWKWIQNNPLAAWEMAKLGQSVAQLNYSWKRWNKIF